VRDELERLGRGAPRLRIAALAVVGLLVVALVGYALLRPDATGSATATLDGTLCAAHDGRVWSSPDTVVPPGEALTIQGTWTDTGPQTAQLTTPAGRTYELRTTQPEGDVLRVGDACAIGGP
jgi:hypothetical protein